MTSQNEERRLHEKKMLHCRDLSGAETLGLERKMAFKNHRNSVFCKGLAQTTVLLSLN